MLVDKDRGNLTPKGLVRDGGLLKVGLKTHKPRSSRQQSGAEDTES